MRWRRQDGEGGMASRREQELQSEVVVVYWGIARVNKGKMGQEGEIRCRCRRSTVCPGPACFELLPVFQPKKVTRRVVLAISPAL